MEIKAPTGMNWKVESKTTRNMVTTLELSLMKDEDTQHTCLIVPKQFGDGPLQMLNLLRHVTKEDVERAAFELLERHRVKLEQDSELNKTLSVLHAPIVEL